MRRPVAATFTLAALVMSSPAHAEELWVGVYAHDVTPISATEFESGVDVQLGWRGKAFEALGSIGRPAPYAFVGVNAGSGTDYAAAGLSWRWGSSVYRSEEHTSELQSLMRISYDVFCLHKNNV